jgi:hypothetical protein
VKKYWKEHPSLAIEGWWWRLRQFLGLWTGNTASKVPLDKIHTFSVSLLFILLVLRFTSAFVKRKFADGVYDLISSLGILFFFLFLIYSAFHALFAYIGFRYASVTIPLFIAADAFLLCELAKKLSDSFFKRGN